MTTPIAALELTYFLQGAGMGIVMPTATELVMSVVPRERSGAGSAITNTSRQVAVALGVAVLGSILARIYRSGVGPGLRVLPASSRAAASQSVAATDAAAAHLIRGSAELTGLAGRSFIHAMHATTVVSAVIAATGAVLIAIWMPGLRAAARRARVGDVAASHRPAAVLVED
jgi:MFS family permease